MTKRTATERYHSDPEFRARQLVRAKEHRRTHHAYYAEYRCKRRLRIKTLRLAELIALYGFKGAWARVMCNYVIALCEWRYRKTYNKRTVLAVCRQPQLRALQEAKKAESRAKYKKTHAAAASESRKKYAASHREKEREYRRRSYHRHHYDPGVFAKRAAYERVLNAKRSASLKVLKEMGIILPRGPNSETRRRMAFGIIREMGVKL